MWGRAYDACDHSWETGCGGDGFSYWQISVTFERPRAS